MKLFNLEGKTALVTGGGRGLGKSMALSLAEAGANVAVASRTEKELKEVAKEIDEFSVKSYYKVLDVTDQKSIKSCVKELIEEEGKIDILINAAGGNRRTPLLDVNEDDWEFVMNLNLKSVLFCSQAVIPYMQKQQSGKIINVASLSSEIGLPNLPLYGASKGGVSQLTKSLALDFASDGISVNAIGPGYFQTKMTESVFKNEERVESMKNRIPMGRFGELDDIKGTSVFLASSAADYITGQTIYVDGGWLSS